ncbi:hypothetical protein SAMN03080615_01704 [Amphritea atlantica]|uniref:Uncharacterized protein n=1 Tax=Amphritea atlantica TaxID=355243 RepID=A0A1H9GIP0_9GAMM|nr:hypothetical protein [Amphritea atlantica]SEQ49956.1 hypothetical protein SAMN03080615_01704 [Amphritea atlantica]
MTEIIPTLKKQTFSRKASGETRFTPRPKDLLEDDYLCQLDLSVNKVRRCHVSIELQPSQGDFVFRRRRLKTGRPERPYPRAACMPSVGMITVHTSVYLQQR